MNSSIKLNYNIVWKDEIESTNTFVLENQDILEDKTIIATLNQTKGRGTKKRTFKSIPQKTLAFSILLKKIDLSYLIKIPIMIAICFIQTAEKFSVNVCKIKWFNDILIENKKIAGILCESKILNKTANIVIGVGANILSTEEELINLSLLKATSIFSKTNIKIVPANFLNVFVETFDNLFKTLVEDKNNEKKLIDLYEKNCQTIGKNIKIFNLKTGEIFFGKALNLMPLGHLLISCNNNLTKIDYNNFSIEEIN